MQVPQQYIRQERSGSDRITVAGRQDLGVVRELLPSALFADHIATRTCAKLGKGTNFARQVMINDEDLGIRQGRPGSAPLIEHDRPLHTVRVHLFSLGGRVDAGAFAEVMYCEFVFWVAQVG